MQEGHLIKNGGDLLSSKRAVALFNIDHPGAIEAAIG